MIILYKIIQVEHLLYTSYNNSIHFHNSLIILQQSSFLLLNIYVSIKSRKALNLLHLKQQNKLLLSYFYQDFHYFLVTKVRDSKVTKQLIGQVKPRTQQKIYNCVSRHNYQQKDSDDQILKHNFNKLGSDYFFEVEISYKFGRIFSRYAQILILIINYASYLLIKEKLFQEVFLDLQKRLINIVLMQQQLIALQLWVILVNNFSIMDQLKNNNNKPQQLHKSHKQIKMQANLLTVQQFCHKQIDCFQSKANIDIYPQEIRENVFQQQIIINNHEINEIHKCKQLLKMGQFFFNFQIKSQIFFNFLNNPNQICQDSNSIPKNLYIFYNYIQDNIKIFLMRPNQTKNQPVVTKGTTNTAQSKPSTTTTTKTTNMKDQPQRQFKDQLLKKIQFCSTPFDLNDDSRHIKQKNQRLTYLHQIGECLSDQNWVQSAIIPYIDQVIQMIEKNIFRPLPVLKKAGVPGQGVGGMEQEQLLVDPAWPHLQPVYQFFLQLIVNQAADVKTLKVFITHSFVQQFLELFDSEQPRQRQYLKNILHRLYAKLVPRRKMIRKAITDCFYSLIHQNFKFNGASELLDILASIISGFAVPLRQQHVSFFKSVIIPLHKVQTCHLYHQQLMRCSMLFLAKDPVLGLALLEGLLRYWPFANSPKQIMFISELNQVLQACEIQKLQPYIPKLFKRLVKCIAGLHLQVADRAMCFFENDYFLNILKTYKSYTFPLLVPVICHMAQKHWHKVLQESLNALKTILREIDSVAFDRALQKKDSNKTLSFLQDPKNIKKDKAKLQDKWKNLLKLAQQKNPNLKQPVLPYVQSHVVGDHNGINNGNVNIL